MFKKDWPKCEAKMVRNNAGAPCNCRASVIINVEGEYRQFRCGNHAREYLPIVRIPLDIDDPRWHGEYKYNKRTHNE